MSIDLHASIAAGLSWIGVDVVEIEFKLADGRVQRIQLPGKTTVDTDSELAKKIMEVLELSDVPLSRKQVAMKLKRKTIGGTFSQTVSAMLETSQLVERDKLLTDDLIKFGDGTYGE